MGSHGMAEAVDGEQGFTLDFALADDELAFLREMISIQWLYRLQLLVPGEVRRFREAGIARYHTLAQLVDHANVWPKTARVLPEQVVRQLRETRFFKRFEEEWGSYEISDEENFGWPNVYWRLVRPGNSDIGPVHADKWFWDCGHGTMPDYPAERVKCWIAIHTAPGRNGLTVKPGSHRRDDWKWHPEDRGGLRKPVLDEDPAALGMELQEMAPGAAIIFHDKLLHGGAVNHADTTRVSLEFTLIVPRHND
jgi:hypothetical protein